MNAQPPRTYRASISAIAPALLVGVAGLGFLAYLAVHGRVGGLEGLAPLLPLVVGSGLFTAWATFTLLRFRFAFGVSTIDLVTAFGRRTVAVDAVIGRRFYAGARGGLDADVLELRKGAGPPLRIVRVFEPDDAYLGWLAQFPDLSESEYRAAKAAFESDHAIAVSQLERNEAITRARRIGWLLASLAVGSSIWLLATRGKVVEALWAAAAVPWLAVICVLVRPALWTLVASLKDGRVSLTTAYVAPAVALMLAAGRGQVVDLAAMLTGAITIFVASAFVDRSLRRSGLVAAVAAMTSLAYGFGITAVRLQ